MKKTKTPPQSQDLAADFLPWMDAERKKERKYRKITEKLTEFSLAM